MDKQQQPWTFSPEASAQLRGLMQVWQDAADHVNEVVRPVVDALKRVRPNPQPKL